MTIKLERVEAINEQDNTDFAQPIGLQDFAHEVQKKLRGVKITPRDKKTSWVYRETDLIAMGYIGYGDFQTSRYGDDMFMVASPFIENGKYADYNEQYYMRMSKNRATSLKHASAFIRKMSPRDVMYMFVSQVSDKVRRASNHLEQKLSTAWSDLGVYSTSKGDTMLMELKHLMDVGHTFLTPDIPDKINAIIEARAAVDTDKNKVTPVKFIHVYEKFGRQVYDTVNLNDVNDKLALKQYTIDPNKVQVELETGMEAMPEELRNRLAALHMLDVDDYADEVGVKLATNAYILHA